MSDRNTLREQIRQIYFAALDRTRAAHAVAANLRIRDDGTVVIAGEPESSVDGVRLVAIGKAAVQMAVAAEEALGGLLVDGVVVTKALPEEIRPRSRTMIGSHPVPDERSIAAGDAVLEFARAVPEHALVLCLISGGGSALVESLRPGATLDELRQVTSDLLRAGASIQELNAVRSRLSAIKAGGLLRALQPARVVNIIVSDVLGDDLHAIASGPTVPPSPEADPNAVLARYRVSCALPEAGGNDDLPTPRTIVVANVSLAIDAAAEAARRLGYAPIVLTRSYDGEAREIGRLFAGLASDAARGANSFAGRVCLLAGGEPVVTVRGSGTGGRNTEAALAAAIRATESPGVAIGFLATDGDDGTSGVAGAIVDGGTVTRETLGEARQALDRNDSFPFLRDRRATLETGPTGTNVNDLAIVLIDPPGH